MKAFWFICLLVICRAALAGLSVHLEPTTIHSGETFRLTLTIDTIQNRAIPDLTPLLKDFDIVGTERNIAYTAINGQARSISQWGIVLKPKKAGTLIIPSIQVGQERSLQNQVVVKTSALQEKNQYGDTPSDTRFAIEVDEKSPYLHQQVIYTVRLLTPKRLLDAQYHPPHIDDALLIPLGDGRHYQTEINGETYAIEEQPYAVFPQKPGKLTISPPSLDALALGDFGPDNIRVEGQPLTLTVKPIPQHQSTESWLPAHAVTLKENDDVTDTNFFEGDTLIRTITLKAKGAVAELLPIPTFNNTEQYRAYVEKPVTQNDIDNGEVCGSVRIQVTYLLHQAGKIVLPAIHIPWYNPVTKENKVATLPEHTVAVHVRPGSKKTLPKHPIQTQKTHLDSHPKYASHLLWWVITPVVISVLSFLCWWWQKQKTDVESHTETDPIPPLRKACKENNPHQVRTALLQWAKRQWPNQSILNLDDLPITDPVFKEALQHLSQALYASKQATTWSGEALWQCIVAFKPAQKPRKKRGAKLPPMNPNSGSRPLQ